jgi:hypothetical protein
MNVNTPFILAVPQADLKHWNLKEERQSMRKLIYAINLILDGCCDHTKFKLPDHDQVLEHYTHLPQCSPLAAACAGVGCA